jgi:hypothetical protein
VIHDYLYRHGAYTPIGPTCSRADADAALKDAMIAAKVSWWRVWIIYLGVRLGGWKRWRWYRTQGGLT